MTVKELIELLQEEPEDSEVVVFISDDGSIKMTCRSQNEL